MAAPNIATTNNVPKNNNVVGIGQITLSPAQVAANTTAQQTFTLTGLATTYAILSVSKPTAQAGLGIVGWRITAANTIGIDFINATASPITPTASEVYTIAWASPAITGQTTAEGY